MTSRLFGSKASSWYGPVPTASVRPYSPSKLGSSPLPLTSSAPNSSSACGLEMENDASARPDRKDADGEVSSMTAVLSSVASQEE